MDNIISLFLFILTSLLIYAIWHLGFQKLFLDNFRHNLFQKRDKLFDYAMKGHISFDSQSYIAMRSYVNILLRYSHRISIIDYFVMIYCTKESKRTAEDCRMKLLSILEENNKKTKNYLINLFDEINKESLKYFLYKNVYIIFFLSPFFLVKLVHSVYRDFSYKSVKKETRKIIQAKMEPLWELPVVDYKVDHKVCEVEAEECFA